MIADVQLKGIAAHVNSLRSDFTVDAATSKVMKSNRSKETAFEITFRKALRKAEILGYRKNLRSLPGQPDIVFTKHKLAVFLHGCYWHRCPKCHPRMPKRNADFWAAKFDYNKQRDQSNIVLLERMGYKVIVLWECEIKVDMMECVNWVRSALELHDNYSPFARG